MGRHAGRAAVIGHDVEQSSEDGRDVQGSASRDSGHGPGSPSHLKESDCIERKVCKYVCRILRCSDESCSDSGAFCMLMSTVLIRCQTRVEAGDVPIPLCGRR